MKKKILSVIPMNGQQKRKLEEAAQGAEILYQEVNELTKEQVQKANIILGNVPPAWIEESEQLEWLHLNSAGADAYVVPGILNEKTLLTNSTGAYGKAVSELSLIHISEPTRPY